MNAFDGLMFTYWVFHSGENRLVVVSNRMFRDGLANNGNQHQRFFRMLCSVHHRCCALVANQCSMVSMMTLLVLHGHGYRPNLLFKMFGLIPIPKHHQQQQQKSTNQSYLWVIWRTIARIWLFCSASHYDRSFPNVA